jgi:hypothetical protein
VANCRVITNINNNNKTNTKTKKNNINGDDINNNVTCLGYLVPLRHVFTLLKTPFGLLHLFIYDFTSRHYNLFLQCALTLWRCVSVGSWFLCSGPWISCDLVFCDLCWSLLGSAAFICQLICLLCSVFCFSLLCSVRLSAAPEVGCWRPGEKTPCRKVSFLVLALLRFPTIRLLSNS